REAEARAQQQSALTESEISITVQSNEGRAQFQRSLQDAEKIRCLAEAEADKTARIGIAQAIAIEEQVRAYGGPKFQVTQEVMSKFAQAIAEAKVDVVPRVVVGGGQNGGSAGLIEGLLAMLSDKLGEAEATTKTPDAPPAIAALRDKVRSSVMASLEKPNGKAVSTVEVPVVWKSH
ncbi:MAG: flotillin family protein, partial [Polyangiaceae bacterium]